ncbi:PiggyBac transposable element-derived protein 2 [Trichinella sp. T6]|nr:PiggyBac transposable element-derived protein 2 [Trichinella sp. T6]
MGLVPMPRYSMYWSTEVRCDAIADAGSGSEAVLDRESPRYNRLSKKRPLIESIRQSYLRLEHTSQRSQRNGVSKLTHGQECQGYCSTSAFMKLCETVPKHRNFKIFFDNYFTHLDLQLRLLKKGIHTIGTIRRNRLKNAPLKTEKELKKAGRGAFHVCTTAENNLCIVRWHDSAVVDLSSTYVCTQPVCKVKRWNKKDKTLDDVSCPAIVKEYNKYMGGENFFWTLHVAVVNGWLQYKRDLKASEAASSSQKDLMHFTLDVAEALTKVNKAYERKSRGRVTSTANPETSRRRYYLIMLFVSVNCIDDDEEKAFAVDIALIVGSRKIIPVADRFTIAYWPFDCHRQLHRFSCCCIWGCVDSVHQRPASGPSKTIIE